jgi:hypothetical protein
MKGRNDHENCPTTFLLETNDAWLFTNVNKTRSCGYRPQPDRCAQFKGNRHDLGPAEAAKHPLLLACNHSILSSCFSCRAVSPVSNKKVCSQWMQMMLVMPSLLRP